MHHKSEENLGEALMSASSPRTLAAPSPSGTSRSHDFWWWEIPGLTASPSLRRLTSICLPSLCDSDSPAVWTLLSHATKELTQWFWCGGWWTQKFCTCMALSPMSTMGDYAWPLSLQGCWRSQEGRTSRAEKSYDQGKDVWVNEPHQLFSSHIDLMLYGCLLPLRTDLELTLLRPLNKLQQPLELFCRHLNKRKENGWNKKFFFKKKVIERGVGKGTLFNIQRPLSSAKWEALQREILSVNSKK